MTAAPHTIAPLRTLTEAHDLMRAHRIRHLPVIADGKLRILGREVQVKLASRYALFGMLVGLLAPAGLLIYGLANRGGFDPVWFSMLLASGGMIVFAIVGSMIGRRDDVLLQRNSELAALSGKLAALSTTDALTGLDNRRSFDDRLAMEMARMARYDVPCALVMIDLDRFKAVNDRHGHQAGDEVLRHVAALLSAEKRSGDMIGGR